MFTSRGYRQAKRENRNKSRQGQIIQQKPVFQIDNNPLVLDAYKKFLLGTMPQNLLSAQMQTDNYDILLSDYSLSWNTVADLDIVYSKLLTFAQNIFAKLTTENKYPISLELYSPNLDDTKGWILSHDSYPMKKNIVVFKSIIIDRLGNLSFTQNLNYTLYFSDGSANLNKEYFNLGSGLFTTPSSPTLGSPSAMKMSVNYFTFYKGN